MDVSTTLDPTAAPPSDDEQCDQILIKEFGSCADEVERSLLACAIALVLPKQRTLKLKEVHGAIDIFVLLTYGAYLQMSHRNFQTWIDQYCELFTRNEDDTLGFSHRGMARFLRENAIWNVDTTHYTIALLCFAQKERYRHLQNELEYSAHAWWFLDYAERYGRYHYVRSGEYV